jgi:hypothetical protein
MTADEKADWPKNKIEDLVKAVERLNDAVDETSRGAGAAGPSVEKDPGACPRGARGS